jgi:hypothetical protein
LRKHYELKAEDQAVAFLSFRSLFGSFATGESADGCWTMKRAGFFRPRATVRRCDSGTDIASFRDSTWTNGGTLTLEDGRSLFATSNFFKSKFALQDEKHEDLIVFSPGGLIHASCTVNILPGARKMLELPWLVLLGWYLIIQKNEEDTAAIAAG